MPNWCTGVLKVRGKKENVLSLLAEFAPFLDVESDDETINIISNDKIHVFNGVRRAMLQASLNEELYFDHESEVILIFDNVEIAWGMAAKEHGWCEMSKKHDIDFRWHGFEQGMRFHQDTEIIKGELKKDFAHEYDGNYEWDCVHPNWGG